MATYKIKITKTEEVLKKINSYEKIADSGNEHDGKSIYGYVPTEKMVENEDDILEMTVENLVVSNVITSILTNSDTK